MMFRQFPLYIAVALWLFTPALLADENKDAQTQFDALFADRIKAVRESKDMADDIKLATQMTGYISSKDLTKAFRALLCVSIIDLTQTDPGTQAIRNQAIRTLLKLGPEHELDARILMVKMTKTEINRLSPTLRDAQQPKLMQQLIALARTYEKEVQPLDADRIYREALVVARKVSKEAQEEIKQARINLKARIKSATRLKTINEQIMNKPSESLALEATKILILEYNNPRKAKMYAKASGDETWLNMVELLAGQSPGKMSDEHLIKVTGWWKDLKDQVPDFALPGWYQRAYQLSKAGKERDSLKAVAKIEMNLVHDDAKKWLDAHRQKEKAIRQAGGPVKQDKNSLGNTVDLVDLAKTEIADHPDRFEGWGILKGRLFLKAPNPGENKYTKDMIFPLAAKGTYVVETTIYLLENRSALSIILPVDDTRHFMVTFGRGNIPSHYEAITGFIVVPIPSGKAFRCKIEITPEEYNAQLRLWVNGKLIKTQTSRIRSMNDWGKSVNVLTIRPLWNDSDLALGKATIQGELARKKMHYDK